MWGSGAVCVWRVSLAVSPDMAVPTINGSIRALPPTIRQASPEIISNFFKGLNLKEKLIFDHYKPGDCGDSRVGGGEKEREIGWLIVGVLCPGNI